MFQNDMPKGFEYQHLSASTSLGRLVCLAFVLLFTACTMDLKVSDLSEGSVIQLTYISGEISGTGGSGVKLVNTATGEVITLNSDGNFQFSQGVSQDTSYQIQLQSAEGLACLLSGHQGSGSTTAVVSIQCDPFAVEAVYPGTQWMDYVEGTLTNRYSASGTACNPGVSANCFHAGQLRKGIATRYNSCDGLTASDALNAFNWLCKEDGGNATLYIGGFRLDKRLADLIENQQWLENRLRIYHNGLLVGESSAAQWWNNRIVELPNNGVVTGTASVHRITSGNGYQAGDILTVSTTRDTYGYSLELDKLALVVENDQKLSFSNQNDTCDRDTGLPTGVDRECMIFSNGRSFLWFEGRYDGLEDSIGGFEGYVGLLCHTCHFLQVWNAELQEFLYHGLWLQHSDHIRVEQSRLAHIVNGIGVTLEYPDDGIFQNLYIYNFEDWGINGSGYGAGNRNIFSGILSVGGGWSGIDLACCGADHIVSHATAVSGGGYSFEDVQASQVAAVAAYYDGIQINQDTTVSDLAALHSGDQGLYITAGATTYSVQDAVVFGNNFTSDCQNHAAGNVDVGATACTGTGFTRYPGSSMVGGFRGFQQTDTKNPHVASFPSDNILTYTSITDWLSFDSLFKGWYLTENTTDMFAISNRRYWCGETGSHDSCSIWDLRLTETSPLTNIHGQLTDGQACPSSVHGDEALVSVIDSAPYLKRAREVLNDGIGNENGLCESDETCIFSPNIGVYQGEGDPSKECEFQDDGSTTVVTNVRMLGR